MSNAAVGAVYAEVIKEVIEQSLADFEENGVDDNILNELKQGWEKRLTKQQYAVFPWDPKPEPPAAPAPAPAPVSAQAPPMPALAPQPATQAAPNHGTVGQGLSLPTSVAVKTEPEADSESAVKSAPTFKVEPGLEDTADRVAQRVAQNLQQQYGERANATIVKLTETMGQPHNGGQVQSQASSAQSMQLPHRGHYHPQANAQAAAHQQYRMQMAMSQAQQVQHVQQQRALDQAYHMQRAPADHSQLQSYNSARRLHAHAQAHAPRTQQALQAQQGHPQQGHPQQDHLQQGHQQGHPQQAQPQQHGIPNTGPKPSPSQMDGADGEIYEGVLLQQDASGRTTEYGRVELDRTLHAHIAARAKSLQGGGLMLPLNRKSKRDAATYHRGPTGTDAPSAFDGNGDDGVKDEDVIKGELSEDAINSDLDDPEDDMGDESDEEQVKQVMLCMYDKVQRVKNKWKCVLRDGVLTINNKDYVFHRATGEYEW